MNQMLSLSTGSGFTRPRHVFFSESFCQSSFFVMFCESDAKSYGCDISPVHFVSCVTVSSLHLRTLPQGPRVSSKTVYRVAPICTLRTLPTDFLTCSWRLPLNGAVSGLVRRLVGKLGWLVSMRLLRCMRLLALRLEKLEAVGWKELEVLGREYGLTEKKTPSNGQQMTAKALQHGWKHEIQIALLRRRAAVTRADPPDTSASWLVS